MYLYYKKNSSSLSEESNHDIASLVDQMKSVKSGLDVVPFNCLHALHHSDNRKEALELAEEVHQHTMQVSRLAELEARFPSVLNELKEFPFTTYSQLKATILKSRKSLKLALFDCSQGRIECDAMLLQAVDVLKEICHKFNVHLDVTIYNDIRPSDASKAYKLEGSFPTVKSLFVNDFIVELDPVNDASSEQNKFEHYLSQLGIRELFPDDELEILFNHHSRKGVERHLLIVWEYALPAFDLLRESINLAVDIIGEHEIKWPADQFDQNMLRFYNQPEKIIEGKIKRVGRGDSLLLIVEDKQPEYGFRKTSRSVEYVNTMLFDLKDRLRSIAVKDKRIPQRWPDLIHATNSTREYLHDFMLLFGFHADQYDSELGKEKSHAIKQSLIGANGWASFEELFDCMNSCLEYVVMRNWDGLPDEATIQGHDDIDFLVDSLPSAMRILKAKKVFQRSYRVHCEINVGGRPIRIDLRAIGDEYYPEEMQRTMLKNRVLEKCFYVPNAHDHFYSLAYHAVIHKESIGDDYVKKLQSMRPDDVITHRRMIELLAQYMKDNNWVYTRPEPSVRYNKKHIFLSSIMSAGDSNTSNFEVTDDCLIKKTPVPTIKFDVLNREILWLKKMKGWKRVPQIKRSDSLSLTIDYAGEQLKRHNMPQNYREQIEDIIQGLKKFGCSHNDIWSENLLVDRGVIKLIDFQWATNIGEPIPKGWPSSIGDSSSFGRHNFIDEYSIWVSVKKILEGRDGRGK